MKLGLIGFPASGKTSLYNAITGARLAVGTYAGAPEVQLAAVTVPDPRLAHLGRVFKSPKVTPAQFDCADVTGLIQGADGRHEVRSDLLAKVRELDCLALVVRAFADEAVPHVKGAVDPERDLADTRWELLLADLALAENRIKRLEVAVTKPTPHVEDDRQELELVRRCLAHLEEEKPLRELELSSEAGKLLRGFQFLTAKPELVLFNVGEDQLGAGGLGEKLEATHPGALAVCAQLEREIAELEENDRGEFLQAMGLSESLVPRLIRAAYDRLGLCSFFTVVGPETRAWTIRKGETAVQAAGRIHADMARGFVRAETVGYAEFVALGAEMKKVKDAGKLRLEGKNYLVQDGDILTIRFNV